MPLNDPPLASPVRGTPGGWRDPWEIDDAAEMRAELEEAERRLLARVARTRRRLIAERKAEERRRMRRRLPP
jgi:hypothetical protein